jgi:FkbM family methyltransferase
MHILRKACGEVSRNRRRLPLFFLYHALIQPVRLFNELKFRLLLSMMALSGCPHVRMPGGLRMALNPEDGGISRDLILDPDRESHAQALLRGIGPGDTVIDAGANIGYYSIKLSRIIGETGSLYAIEPAESSRRLLIRNLADNRCNNATIHTVAFGDRAGRAKLFLNTKKNLNNMLGPSYGEIIGHQDVEMTTLDEFVAERGISPNFIRMDTEGYEYNILMGAKKTLKAGKDLALMVEFHADLMGKGKSSRLLRMLKSLGFESVAVVYDNVFYPDARQGSMLYRALMPMWCRIAEVADPSLFAKVRTDITIDRLLADKKLLGTRFACPNILFRKKITA